MLTRIGEPSGDIMASLEDIIASATLREETTTLCVAGSLNAEHEAAVVELRKLDDWKPVKLGDADPRKQVAARIVELEEQMREHEYTFRFRALPSSQWRTLLDEFTDADGNRDVGVMAPAVVAACAVEPTFADVAQAQALFDKLTQAQVDDLFLTAWRANTGRADVPKSARASALMESSEPK